ncbi:ComF family protein [Litoribacter ruber]|nr:phosphoribosyltransferase family protein [Litoribacter alkaliphilus]
MMRFNFLEDFLALVFPQTCSGCKTSLYAFEFQLCRKCEASLPITSYHLRPKENDLTVKLLGLTKADRVLAFLRFSKNGLSQKLLHQLKYKNKPQLGVVLGKLYGQKLIQAEFDVNWDFIIAVPLHPAKLRRRGYNQSAKFAMGISAALAVPVHEGLQRTKFTQTQTKKSRMERWENVKNVFHFGGKELEGKYVLLVDDVMTTGATLAACANALLAAGVKKVDLAVIAAGTV